MCPGCGRLQAEARAATPGTSTRKADEPDVNTPIPSCDRTGQLSGRRLGEWLVEELLGRGGMGEVYRAIHPTGRVAAFKVLLESAMESPSAAGRFRREVRVMARLEHPAVARILFEELDQSPPYFAMEWLAGGSLHDRIRVLVQAGTLAPAMAPAALAQLARQLASGLSEIHRHSILHRDIKPHNILFSESGQAKLTDFGLATMSDATCLTAPRQRMGSIAYMAPETLRTGHFDERTDLYQLGISLYHTCAGECPYDGPELMAVAVGKPLPPLPLFGPSCDALRRETPWFEPLVRRLCSEDPEARPGSAEALGEALDQAMEGLGKAKPVSRRAAAAAGQRLPESGRARSTHVAWSARLDWHRWKGPVLAAACGLWMVCLAAIATSLWSRGPSESGSPGGPRLPEASGQGSSASAAAESPGGTAAPAIALVTAGSRSLRFRFDGSALPGSRLTLQVRGQRSGRLEAVAPSARECAVAGLQPGTVFRCALTWPGGGRREVEAATLPEAAGGGLVLERGGDPVGDLELQARGPHVVAVWATDPGKPGPVTIHARHSFDSGQTWTPAETLYVCRSERRSLSTAMLEDGALVGWRAEPARGGASAFVFRFWDAAARRWEPAMEFPAGSNQEGVCLVPADGGATQAYRLMAPAGSEAPCELDVGRVPRSPGEPLPAERLLVLPPRVGGRLKVLSAGARTFALMDSMNALGNWTLLWSATGVGGTGWKPALALTGPDDSVGFFDAAELDGGVLLAYVESEVVYLRNLTPELHPSPAPRLLDRSELVQRSPCFVRVGKVLYLGYLSARSLLMRDLSVRILRTTDGVAWLPHAAIRLAAGQGKSLRLALCGKHLLALAAGIQGELTVFAFPL